MRLGEFEMGFSTPATRSTDIPIIETQPRRLPSPTGVPMEPFTIPVREPDYVPAKRSSSPLKREEERSW